jgi:hypothetical protein
MKTRVLITRLVQLVYPLELSAQEGVEVRDQEGKTLRTEFVHTGCKSKKEEKLMCY